MERMKLTEKEKEQILKNGAEAMSRIIERMSIKMGELEEENKKLQIEIGGLMGERDGKQMRIDELEEENKNLKSDLEQFSEAYKRYRDFEKEELADSCYDLEKENKKLKEELSKYKKQYQHSMGFSDFGGYDEDEHIVKDENTYRDLDL